MTAVAYDVVVPTLGRESLRALLLSLDRAADPRPGRVILVDDRRTPPAGLAPLEPGALSAAMRERLVVVSGYGGGPAAARNTGRRLATAPWVAFLDDDVVLSATWAEGLQADLAALGPEIAGSYARIVVPLPPERAPTDWERNVAGLADATYITADAAFRRAALEEVGGFDPRFPRAFREDADLALRLQDAGYGLVSGTRLTEHPVRPADARVSVRLQRGNADDAMMDALHGPDWYDRAHAERGAIDRHVRIMRAACDFALAALRGDSARAGRTARLWLLETAAFAALRIAPGPRDPREVATMLATSVVLPFAAVVHRARGRRRAAALPARAPAAVLFDRDGTLIVDAPVDGDPDRVTPMPGARAALDRLRAAGVRIGVVTNQDAVAAGRVTRAELAAVHRRVEELLGPIAVWEACTHAADGGCDCRKPAPGLVDRAARRLGVATARCVVVGDIGSDVAAAQAAGARAVLVPTSLTRVAEIAAAPLVASSLEGAVDLVLAGIA